MKNYNYINDTIVYLENSSLFKKNKSRSEHVSDILEALFFYYFKHEKEYDSFLDFDDAFDKRIQRRGELSYNVLIGGPTYNSSSPSRKNTGMSLYLNFISNGIYSLKPGRTIITGYSSFFMLDYMDPVAFSDLNERAIDTLISHDPDVLLFLGSLRKKEWLLDVEEFKNQIVNLNEYKNLHKSYDI